MTSSFDPNKAQNAVEVSWQLDQTLSLRTTSERRLTIRIVDRETVRLYLRDYAQRCMNELAIDSQSKPLNTLRYVPSERPA